MARSVQRRPLCAVLFAAFAALVLAARASAQPATGQVTHGSATFNRSGNLTTITAANNTVIHYNNFDIAADQTVQFIQPSSTSKVLNWVNSSLPTHIDGSLFANGQVYLGNAAGIYFGPTSYVNVGALYAAGGSISSDDFLHGANRFTQLTGVVSNDGLIHAQTVSLVGQLVANHGSIRAPDGFVTLAAGKEVYLAEPGSAIIVSASSGQKNPRTAVDNTGTIDAGSGHALLAAGDLYSVAISQSGTVRGQHITLDGGRNGVTQVSGTLDASQPAPGATGGEIHVLGGQVELTSTAKLAANGGAAGGTVLVGGDLHGANPAIPNATSTRIQAGATLAADALHSGNGGEVVVWSDQVTDFSGSISARGGPQGGNGGFAEVSGKQLLNFNGFADLRAPAGKLGTLLLDPDTIEIVTTGGSALTGHTVNSGDTPTDSKFTPDSIVTQLNTGNVVLQAGNTITVIDPIDSHANANAGDLTLQALGNITVQANVTLNGNFIVQSDTNGNSLGTYTQNASVAVAANSVSISAADLAVDPTATINAGSGTITLTPSTDARAINFGTGASSAFNVDPVALNHFTAGTVVVGRTTGTGAIGGSTLNLVADPFDLTLQGANTGGSSITFSGDVTLDPGQTLRLASNGAMSFGGALNVGSGSTGGAVNLVDTNSFAVTGALTAKTFVVPSGNYSVTLSGSGTTITDPVAFNNLTLTIGSTDTDTFTFSGGFTSAATTNTFRGSIASSDQAISFGSNPLTLAGATAFDAGNGALTLGAVTAATHDLTLTGNGGVTLNGNLAGVGTLQVNGAASFGGTGVDGSSITFANTLTLGHDTTLTASTALSLQAVTAGVHALTLTSDTLSLGGDLTGTGNYSLQPVTPTRTIGLGDSAAGDFSLSNAALAHLATSGLVTIGRTDGTGTITGSSSLDLSGSSFDLTLRGDSAALSFSSLTLAAGKTLTLDSTGTMTFSGAVNLGSNGTLALVNSGGLEIDGALTTGTLTIPSGTYGVTLLGSGTTVANAVTFINSSVTLGATDTDTFTFAGGLTSTTSANSFRGVISTTNQPIALGAVSLAGNLTLQSGSGVLGIGAVTGNSHDLSLNSGGATFNGDLIAVADLTVAGSADLGTHSLSTTNITFSGALTLSGPSSTLSASDTLSLAGVSAGTTALTLEGTQINLTGGANSVVGTGALILQPGSATTPITLGAASDTGSSVLDLTAADLAALKNGFSSLTVGRTDGSTTITAGNSVSFQDPVTLRGGLGSSFSLTGTLTGTDNASVSIATATASLTSAGITTANQSITLGGTTSLFGSGGQTIDAGSSSVSVATLQTGSVPLTLRAGSLAFTGGSSSVSGTSTLLLEPAAAGDAINVGSSGLNFSLTTGNIDALAAGFSSVTVGRSDGTGTFDLRDSTWRSPVVFQTLSGTFDLQGTITGGSGTAGQAVTFQAPSVTLTGTTTIATGGSSSSGNIHFTGAITGAHDLTLDAGHGTVTLGGGLGTLATPLTSLDITTGANLVQSAAWNAVDLTIATSGGNIVLNNTSNAFTGPVALASTGTTAATVVTNTPITLGDIQLLGGANSLSVTAQGNIQQSSTSTAIDVGGAASFTVTAANSNVSLGNSANTFNGSFSAGVSGSGTILALALGNDSSTAALPTLPGTLQTLNINFSNTSLTLPALTLSGNLNVNVGGDLNASGALVINGSGANVLKSGGAINLAAITDAGNLSLDAATGITDSSVVSVTGATTLSAGPTNTVSLSNLGNTLAHVTITDAGDAHLATSGAITFGTSKVEGNLVVQAGTTIGQTGVLTVPGDAFFLPGATSDVTLNQNNLFGAVILSTANNVTLTNSQTVTLGRETTGTHWATLTATTQNGVLGQESSAGSATIDGTSYPWFTGLSLTGAANLTATGTGSITLPDTGNSFGGDVTFDSAGEAQIYGTGTMVFDAASATGAVDLKSTALTLNQSLSGGSGVTLTGPVTLSKTGDQTIDAGTGILQSNGALTKSGSGNLFLLGSAIHLINDVGAVAGLQLTGTTTLNGNLSAQGLTLDSLILNGSGTQNIDALGGSLLIQGTLTKGSGDLTLAGTGGITIDNTTSLPAGSLTFKNAATVGGDLTAKGIIFDSTLALSSAGAQTLDATTGSLTVTGALTKTAGDLTLDGAALSLQGATNTLSAGSLTLDNTAHVTGNITSVGLTSSPALVLDGTGAQTLNAGSSALSITGAVSKALGDLTLGSSAGITLGNNLTVSTGSITFSNSVTSAGNTSATAVTFAGGGIFNGSSDQSVTATTGAVQVAGNLEKTSNGNLALSGATGISFTSAIAQTIQADAGALSFTGNATKTVAGNLTLAGTNGVSLANDLSLSSGALIVSNALNATGNLSARGITFADTVALNGSGAQMLNAGSGAFLADSTIMKALGNLEIAGVAGLNLRGDTTVVTGGLLLDQAATLGGNLTAKNITFSNTVTLDGTVDQALNAGTGSLQATGSLTKTGAGNLTVSGSGGIIFNQDASASNGLLIVTNALTTQGNLSGSLGVEFDDTVTLNGSGTQSISAGSHAFVAKGDLLKTTAGNLTLTSGAGTLSGASAQTISASNGNLMLSNAGAQLAKTTGGALTLSGTTVSVAGSALDSSGRLTVNGPLTLGGDLSSTDLSIQNSVTLSGTGTQTLSASAGSVSIGGDVSKTTGAIAFSGPAILGGNLAAQGLSFSSTVYLDGAAAQTLDGGAGPFTIAGDVTKQNPGLLSFLGTGGTTLSGNVTATTGLRFTDATTFNAAGAQTIDAGAGTLTADGTLTKTISGLFVLKGTALTFNQAVTAVNGIELDGPTSLAGDLSAQGLTLSSVLLNGTGTQTLNAGTGALLIQGDLTKNQGSLVLAGTDGITLEHATTLPNGSITFNNTSTVGDDLSTQGLTFLAGVTLSKAGAQFFDAGTGALLVQGALTKATGDLTLKGALGIELQSDANLSAGGITFVNSTTLGGNVSAQAITFQTSAALTGATDQSINAGTGALLAQGTVTKSSIGNLTLQGQAGVTLADASTTNGLLTITDPLQASGNLTGDGISLDGPVTLNASGIQTLNARAGMLSVGGALTKGAGNLSLQGATGLVLSGPVTVSAGTATFDGPATLDSNASAQGLSFLNTVTLNGTTDQTLTGGASTLTVGGDLVKSSAGNLTLDGQGGLILDGSVTVSGGGALALDHSATVLGNLSANGLTFAQDITLAKNGSQNVDAGSGVVLAQGNVDKTVAGDLVLHGATLNLDQTVNAVGTVQFNGATTLGGNLLANGLTLDSLVLSGLGTQTINAGSGALLIQGTVSKAQGDLVLAGLGGIDLDTTTTLPGGGITFENDATIGGNIDAQSILFNGAIFLDGGAGQVLIAETGTLIISGSGNKTLTGDVVLSAGAGVTLNQDVTVTGGGSLRVTTPLTTNGNLSATGIILTNDVTFSNNGAQSIDAGTGVLEADGNIFKTGSGNLTISGGSNQLNGSVHAVAGIILNGPTSLGGDLTAQGLTINALTLSGLGPQQLDAGSGVLSILGPLNKNSGDLSLAGGAGIFISNPVSVAQGGLSLANSATVSSDLFAQGISFAQSALFSASAAQQIDAGAGLLHFAASMVRQGSSLLTLTGSSIELDGSLTAANAPVVFAGPAQLASDLHSQGLTFNSTITLAGTGAQTLDAGAGQFSTPSSLTKTSGSLVLGGTGGVSVGGDITTPGTLAVTGPLSLVGSIEANGITLTGATLSGGAEAIDAGSGPLVSNGNLTKTSTGALTLQGANLAVTGDIQTPDTLEIAAPLTLTGNIAANGLTFSADSVLTGTTQTIDAGTGVLQSAGTHLSKNGGSLTLAGASGQLGAIDVTSSGTIANDLLESSLNGIWNAGTIHFAHGFSVDGDTTFNSRVSLGSGVETNGHNVTFAGAVTLTQDSAIDSGSGNTTFAATVDGASALTFNLSDLGRVTLNGTVGGLTPLARLVTAGPGLLLVNADITTNGNTQLYGSAVELTHDAVFTELNPTGSISFSNTLDAAPGDSAGLTLNTPGTVQFDGAIGASGALSWLKTDLGGSTTINGGSVTTRGGQSYADSVVFGSNTLLTTNGGAIDFAALDGNGANLSIAASGAGTIHFHSAITHLGTGTGPALQIAKGATGAVTFDGSVSAQSGLVTPQGAPVTFHGDVTLAGGDTDSSFGDSVQLAGSNLTSSGGWSFGKLGLSAGPVTISAGAGRAILVNGAIDGTQALTLNTTGDATVAGNIGSTNALLSLTTDAGGTTTLGGNVHTTGAQTYHDGLILAGAGDQLLTSDQGAVLISASLQKTGSGNLTLHSVNQLTLAGSTSVAHGSLTLDAAVLSAGGDLSAQGITLSHALTLDGNGAQTIDAGSGTLNAAAMVKTSGSLTLKGTSATLTGDVTTSSADLALDFPTVNLAQDLSFSTGSGAGDLGVSGAITGAHALTLKAGTGKISIGGALGTSSTALKSLTADAGSLSFNDVYTDGDQSYAFDVDGNLLLTGSIYTANQGSILLNTARPPRTSIPPIATIAKPIAGDLLFSAGTNVTFGLYEKTSVVGGNLTIRAKQNVTVGDLSVAGALKIETGALTLLTRAPASVQVQDGTATDLGLDLVATTIDFLGYDGVTEIPGTSLSFNQGTAQRNYRVRFATADGQADVPPLPGFSFYRLPIDVFENQSIAQPLFGPFDNVYLDLRAIGYNRANVSSALPPVAPNEVKPVTPKVEVSAALRDDLVKLGIFARPDTELELKPARADAPIYDGIIKSEDRSPELFEVADTRISSEEALNAIRLYHQVFEEREADGQIRNRVGEIQIHFTDAFQAYQRTAGPHDLAGFRRWTEAQGGPVLSDLKALHSLLRQIGRLGLTQQEFSISKTYVLRSIRVPGLPLHSLREVIEADSPPSAGRLLTALDLSLRSDAP